MSDETPAADTPRRPWQLEHYEPSDEERQQWAELGIPSEDEFVTSYLGTRRPVWGAPDKETLFRYADETAEDKEDSYWHNTVKLRVVQSGPVFEAYELASPLVTTPSGIVEHHFNVHLSVLTVDMYLNRICIVSGERGTPSRAVVFEGTELPGVAYKRRLRIIRVTVHEEGYASYEVIASTRYPPPSNPHPPL